MKRKTIYKKIPKLDLAVSKATYKTYQRYVLVTKYECVATDNRILIEYATKEIFDDDFIEKMPDKFLMSGDNWQKMRSLKKILSITFEDGIRVICDGGLDVVFAIKSEKEIGEYVNYKAIFSNKPPTAIEIIGVNPRLLNDIYKIFESDSVRMEFRGASKPIMVYPNSYDYSRGLIMPVML